MESCRFVDLRTIVGDVGTCAPIPTSSPRRSSTGRAASAGATPAVVRPGHGRRGRGRAAARATRPARRSCPRAATPGSSAGRCRCTASSCSTSAASTRSAPVDPRTGQVTAQAGVTLARLQRHARDAGWQYGVDLGARDVATVGGTVATNAGGVHVLRYGPTRRQLVGIEAVLADGRVDPPPRRAREGQHRLRPRRAAVRQRGNARGRHRRARCGCVPRPRAHGRRAARLRRRRRRARRGRDAAPRARLRRRRSSCSSQDGLELVCDRLGLAAAVRRAARGYVLVEAAANTDPTDALGRAVELHVRRRRRRGRDRRRRAARAVALPRRTHRGDQPRSARRTSSTSTLPADELAEFIHEVRDARRGGRAGRDGVAVRPRRRRQHARQRHRRRAR